MERPIRKRITKSTTFLNLKFNSDKYRKAAKTHDSRCSAKATTQQIPKKKILKNEHKEMELTKNICNSNRNQKHQMKKKSTNAKTVEKANRLTGN